MDVVRLGLIGCGGMGRSLAGQARLLEQAKVVAVTDVDEERRAAAAAELEAEPVESYEQLLVRPDIDAVLVATPGGYHRPPVEAAAAFGKHVFSEKPLATNLADADAMIKAVERAGVKGMVGQVCRYHPTHSRLKKMVGEGPLGPVLSMYVERLGGGWGDKHPAWRYSRALSGGNLLEINAHEIDFLLWLAGPVKRVYAVGGQMVERAIDFPDVAFVSLTFQSGAVGVLQSTAIATIGSYQARFDCMDGSAVVPRLFGGEIQYRLRDGSEQRVVTPEEMQVETPVKGEIRAFCDAILSDTEPPVTFGQARAVVAVAEAAYESIETGEPVTLAAS